MKRPGLTLVMIALPIVMGGCARELSLTDTVGVDPLGREAVAVCYSASVSTRQDVIDFALKACPKGTRSIGILEHDTLLNNCPISKKNRVVFQCQGYPVNRP